MFDANTRDMRYIIAVLEEGSLSKAAEKLYTTQPNISRIVQKTEEQIGLPIFNKEKLPWQLTYLGHKYIQTARKILKANDEFALHTKNIIDGEKGLLKIGVMPFEERYLLPNILHKLKRIYPQINFETFITTPIKAEELLYNNLVNFAILVTADRKDIEYIPIKKLQILLALPINHSLAKDYTYPIDGKSFPELEITSLASESFVMMKGTYMIDEIKKIAKNKDVDLKIELTVSTQDAAIAIVQSGYGATFVISEYIVGNVAYFKIKGEDIKSEVSFAYLKNKELNILEQKFLTTIENMTIQYTDFHYN